MVAILFITLTFLTSFILTIIPLPEKIEFWRPQWVVVILIYWIMAMPFRINMGVAFVIGLCLDALYSSILGVHAFSMCVITYILLKLHHLIRVFPLWQQAITLLPIIFFYQIMTALVYRILGYGDWFSYWYCLGSILTAALWPWLFLFLQAISRKLRIYSIS